MIDRILDMTGFIGRLMNVMICGGKGLEIMGFFSVCEGKGNKQNSKALFLKHLHVRLLEFVCLNRVL